MPLPNEKMLSIISSILLLVMSSTAKPIFTPGGNGNAVFVPSSQPDSNDKAQVDAELAGLVNTYDPSTPIDVPGITVRSQRYNNRQDVHPGTSQEELDSVFSRDLNGYWYEATTGTYADDPETLTPIEIGSDVLTSFLAEAQTWTQQAYLAGAAPNATDPNNYFRYSSANLSFTILVYEPHAYNWGDAAQLAGWLYNETVVGTIKDQNTTLGTQGFRDGNDAILKLAVTPSYGDVPYQPAQSADAFTGDTLIAHEISGPPPNVSTIAVGDSKLQIHSGAAKLPYTVLSDLISTVWDNTVMESGNGAKYYQYNSGLDWLGGDYENQVVDFESPGGVAFDDLKKALKVLVQISNKGEWWKKTGNRPSIRAELVDKDGKSVAKFGFGTSAITKKIPCVARNTDGSQTVGCFVRDKL